MGENPNVLPVFNCDYGKNIHVGDDFFINYNGIILDIVPVNIGNHVMIGPNTKITTIGHSLSAHGRWQHLGIARPVDIGNNVVVAAEAVVTKDVSDNCVVGVPAKIIKTLVEDNNNKED